MSFPSSPRSGIPARSGPAFSSQEPVSPEQRASGWFLPSGLRGGGASTTPTPTPTPGPHWELSRKHPHPPHSLCLPATSLNPSFAPWKPDVGMTAKETEVQTGCQKREAVSTRITNWISGLKWGPQVAFTAKGVCRRLPLPNPSQSAFFYPPCM